MRNFLLAALAAVALCGAGLGGALGQSSGDALNRWIKVENESPFIASQIFISPADRDCCWSRDLLEDQVIEAKGEVTEPKGTKGGKDGEVPYRNVNFDDGSGACRFDIHIRNQRYPSWSWLLANFNVCAPPNSKRVITLRSAHPDLTKNRLVIKNDSPFWAYYIYMIPAGQSCCWSRDLLGNRIIPTGRSADVSFHDGTSQCRFDIRITSDKKGIDWFLKDVDVCKRNDRVVGEASRKAVLKTPDITLKGTKVHLITVKNETLLTALTAHTLPSGKDCCWSRDLLGSEVIRGGKSLDVDFKEGSGECTVDVLFTRAPTSRSDSSQWRFDKINVCTETELVLRPPPESGR